MNDRSSLFDGLEVFKLEIEPYVDGNHATVLLNSYLTRAFLIAPQDSNSQTRRRFARGNHVNLLHLLANKDSFAFLHRLLVDCVVPDLAGPNLLKLLSAIRDILIRRSDFTGTLFHQLNVAQEIDIPFNRISRQNILKLTKDFLHQGSVIYEESEQELYRCLRQFIHIEGEEQPPAYLDLSLGLDQTDLNQNNNNNNNSRDNAGLIRIEQVPEQEVNPIQVDQPQPGIANSPPPALQEDNNQQISRSSSTLPSFESAVNQQNMNNAQNAQQAANAVNAEIQAHLNNQNNQNNGVGIGNIQNFNNLQQQQPINNMQQQQPINNLQQQQPINQNNQRFQNNSSGQPAQFNNNNNFQPQNQGIRMSQSEGNMQAFQQNNNQNNASGFQNQSQNQSQQQKPSLNPQEMMDYLAQQSEFIRSFQEQLKLQSQPQNNQINANGFTLSNPPTRSRASTDPGNQVQVSASNNSNSQSIESQLASMISDLKSSASSQSRFGEYCCLEFLAVLIDFGVLKVEQKALLSFLMDKLREYLRTEDQTDRYISSTFSMRASNWIQSYQNSHPFRSSAGQQQPRGAGPQMPNTAIQQICRRFNNNGFCSYTHPQTGRPCNYAHICERCFQQHPSKLCPSADFRNFAQQNNLQPRQPNAALVTQNNNQGFINPQHFASQQQQPRFNF